MIREEVLGWGRGPPDDGRRRRWTPADCVKLAIANLWPERFGRDGPTGPGHQRDEHRRERRDQRDLLRDDRGGGARGGVPGHPVDRREPAHGRRAGGLPARRACKRRASISSCATGCRQTRAYRSTSRTSGSATSARCPRAGIPCVCRMNTHGLNDKLRNAARRWRRGVLLGGGARSRLPLHRWGRRRGAADEAVHDRHAAAL